ncbi:MAG: sodium:solute symporter [Bacteroidetes bacterium]|jgi:SSS family transporter|nr:sodium:solute symporter [Bacteroidota bacterium]
MDISLSPAAIGIIILGYFALIFVISYLTGRHSDNRTFYLGNRNSPWFVVAYGMIGATLSGITFISVPGWVIDRQFSYMQMVLGYLLGYAVIVHVLLPLYYRLNLTSIYTYLESRFDKTTYKSGAFLFIISRTVGASLRLFLMATVLQLAIFDAWNIPFWITVVITIALIWLYTHRGGIKTIIWTDMLQTTFMLLSVGITLWIIMHDFGIGFKGVVSQIEQSDFSRVFYFDDFNDKRFFWKQFLSGAFITIVMTGLDQDMMQKNLTCRSLRDAQKNMYWFSVVLVPVNLLFLSLGVMLVLFARNNGIEIPENADEMFPLLATKGYLGAAVTVFFIIGLVAAAYSSADSALTSLTTSFTVDILGKKGDTEEAQKTRRWVHIAVSLVLLLVIMLVRALNDKSIIATLFTLAGYTYGPLLGLFAFGLFTNRRINGKWVPLLCLLTPTIIHILKMNSEKWLGGYQFDFEILLLNGLLTFIGLLILRKS